MRRRLHPLGFDQFQRDPHLAAFLAARKNRHFERIPNSDVWNYNTGWRQFMFSLLAIVLDVFAVLIPIYLLYRFRSQAWYWHVLAAIVGLAIGLMPGTALLQTEGGSLLYGFSFIILMVWGIGGLIPYRPRHAKHA